MLANKDIRQQKYWRFAKSSLTKEKNEMPVKEQNYCKNAHAKLRLSTAKNHPSHLYGLLKIYWLKSKLTKVINFKYEITWSAHAQNCKI